MSANTISKGWQTDWMSIVNSSAPIIKVLSKSELLSERTIAIDKRVVRLETIIEIAKNQAHLP